ncbi:MAG TPA: POT family MFS transporter [Verrucomicrobiae bacterium]
MAKPFLTAPIKTDKMPPGVPYIVGNEAAERFSYYGLRAILMVYMTQYLLNSQGQKAPMDDLEATRAYHVFQFAVYLFPVIGAIISDAWLGKYRTIIIVSLIYCLGPLLLALDQTRTGLYAGLWLIAIGSGGIKPCVSAHVGDQFGSSNKHLITRVFSWFYFSINFGSFFSTLLTPILLRDYGPRIAFGIPAALMFVATIVFWMGRHKFIHIPPAGKEFVRETFSIAGFKSIARLLPIFAFMPIFWSLYDQSSSRWILQAMEMDRHFPMFNWTIDPSQTHAANPILVLIFIPLFTKLVYPGIDKVWKLTPLRRVGIGLFITVISFLVSAWIEVMIKRGLNPHILWQLLAYIFLTAAEVFVYLTMLEFAYTQAPKKMKSLVMSLSLLSISLGNLLTAGINHVIKEFNLQETLTGATYYLGFAGMMFVAAVLFIFVARTYQEVTILHEEEPAK